MGEPAELRQIGRAEVGTPIHPRNNYLSFRDVIRQAAIRQVRIHNLRHTAASVSLAQGAPVRVVMEIRGHNQISVMLNPYAHVAPDVSRAAADRMNAGASTIRGE